MRPCPKNIYLNIGIYMGKLYLSSHKTFLTEKTNKNKIKYGSACEHWGK